MNKTTDYSQLYQLTQVVCSNCHVMFTPEGLNVYPDHKMMLDGAMQGHRTGAIQNKTHCINPKLIVTFVLCLVDERLIQKPQEGVIENDSKIN